MSKIKIAKALIDATGKPDASYACIQALEEDEREREAKYTALITQMHRDNERFIEQHRADNAKFIDSVQRELQLQSKNLNKQLELQSKQLKFLSWAIPVATAFLALTMVALGIVFAVFGGS